MIRPISKVIRSLVSLEWPLRMGWKQFRQAERWLRMQRFLSDYLPRHGFAEDVYLTILNVASSGPMQNIKSRWEDCYVCVVVSSGGCLCFDSLAILLLGYDLLYGPAAFIGDPDCIRQRHNYTRRASLIMFGVETRIISIVGTGQSVDGRSTGRAVWHVPSEARPNLSGNKNRPSGKIDAAGKMGRSLVRVSTPDTSLITCPTKSVWRLNRRGKWLTFTTSPSKHVWTSDCYRLAACSLVSIHQRLWRWDEAGAFHHMQSSHLLDASASHRL